jgi:hypothetical protein
VRALVIPRTNASTSRSSTVGNFSTTRTSSTSTARDRRIATARASSRLLLNRRYRVERANPARSATFSMLVRRIPYALNSSNAASNSRAVIRSSSLEESSPSGWDIASAGRDMVAVSLGGSGRRLD